MPMFYGMSLKAWPAALWAWLSTSAFVTQIWMQAQAQFEAWHAERWLSPRRVLQKAGAEMRPVLLPFWFFEAAIKVEYCAQVLTLLRYHLAVH